MTTPHTPHGTPEAPLLTVRGEAELETEPEIARITVTLTARGRDRRTTLDDLTRRNTTALDLIKSYGDTVERLTTGTLSLTPELSERGRGERVHAYHGRVHLTADLTDFTHLAELTTRLADLELTRVDGPWWLLRPDSPVYRQARQHAVREAVQRAHEYAAALGTTVTALTELADTGTDRPQPTRAPLTRGLHRATLTGAAEPPEPLDLEPERLHVSAQVSAHFTMAPPTL
ncbi:SIMPL domain-containing protein [Streptomyces sp. NPDC004542]|uniref:SIMPL domain-containing protein n=1 Tax=Streptomyces sp. NPDC004542 TaxID=3154281 RepID=UPI0033AC62D9